MKAYAIIQARFGATRLPGKVLFRVMGKTILEYVLERVKKAEAVEDLIIATTKNKKDIKIAKLAKSLCIKIYRGSEEDVLDRYFQAAKSFKIKHIVRITADCPLIDPRIIDKVVDYYFKSNADYCSNVLNGTYPDGQDVEVFSFNTLKTAWENANLSSEREHVTSYIRNHPERFKLVNLKYKKNLSRKRWTLDRLQDFEFLRIILENLYPKNSDFKMEDVLMFLQDNPRLEKINQGIARNEGYLKSLEEDKLLNIKK